MAYQRVSQVQQTAQYAARSGISDEQAALYFTQKISTPRKAIVAIIVSIVLCLIAFPLHLFIIGIPALLLILFFLYLIYRTYKRRIKDEDYDVWLEQQESIMRGIGYQILNIPRHFSPQSVLCIRSFVPPGTSISHEYMTQDVEMKQGRDGIYRFSITVYTYFFPLQNGMAIFRCSVNAFRAGQYNEEQSEIYPYRDLSTARTVKTRDRVMVDNIAFSYQTEKLYVIFSNGEKECFSAIVRTKLLSPDSDAPTSIIQNALFNVKLNALRALILSNGQSTQLQP